MILTETERLRIRQFTTDDFDALYLVMGDPEVMRFSLIGVRTEEEVRERLAKLQTEYEQNPDIGHWAVVRKEGNEVLGFCGIRTAHLPDEKEPTMELAYRLAKRFWGKGYATEAARALCQYCFEELQRPRLIAIVDADNVASINVINKLGMRYERDVMIPGYDHPDRLYLLERS